MYSFRVPAMAEDLFADLIPPAPLRHYRAAQQVARRMNSLADDRLRVQASRHLCGLIKEMLAAQARLQSGDRNGADRPGRQRRS